MKRNVAILVFEEVEVLDFAGPYEVFAAADKRHGGDAFNVFTVAPSTDIVRCHHGLKIVPEFSLANCPPPAVLVIPGGWGTRALLAQPAILDWVRKCAGGAELVMSVCTGALVLAKAGVLDGLRATTHHGSFALLRETAPRATVVENERFVDNGRVLTAAGISAGIDCSLHVVRRLLGTEAADETARHMEYRQS